MKKLEVIIRPMRLEPVKAALAEELGVVGLTVTDVRGYSRKEPRMQLSSHAEFLISSLSPMIMIEMIIDDEHVDAIIDVIVRNARTGQPGDGKIFVMEMKDAIRIRTGDRGASAL